MSKHFALICLIAATLLVLWVSPAEAAVPARLTQQGRLLDQSDMPVGGDVVFVFSIYAASAGGTALWTEQHTVTLDDGYFSVQLGSKTAFSETVFDGSTRYLGVTAGTDAEMTPRQPLVSVPYALHAGSADDVTCPDPAAPAAYGFCIWHEDNGATYTLNFTQAAAACKAKGARLCTTAEVSAAAAAGAEWCAFSWVADRVDNATAYTAFPMQQVIGGCGGAIGLILNQSAMTTGRDANCCR